MINLAWGGYTNGAIPLSALVDVSGRGDYLEPTAAAMYLAMQAAIKRATGFDLQPAAGSSANRTEATQIEFFTERYTRVSYNSGLWWNGSYWTKNAGAAVAAIPKTSNHGWARAIDLNISRYDTKAWAWMQAHAAEYGFSWATGKASGEDWHWESLTPPGTAVAGGKATLITSKPAFVSEEDEMSTVKLGDKNDGSDIYIVMDHVNKKLRAVGGKFSTEYNVLVNQEKRLKAQGLTLTVLNQAGWEELIDPDKGGFTRIY